MTVIGHISYPGTNCVLLINTIRAWTINRSAKITRHQWVSKAPSRRLTPCMDTPGLAIAQVTHEAPPKVTVCQHSLDREQQRHEIYAKRDHNTTPRASICSSSMLRHSIVQLRKHGDTSLDPMFLSMLLSEGQGDKHDEIGGVPGGAKRSLAHRCLVDRTHVRV